LTNFWDDAYDWDFETLHTYGVQFVVENRACRNGIEYPWTSWNNLKRFFFVCHAGSGCRLGGNTEEIKVAPNPASTFIRLQNLVPKFDRGYEIRIVDLFGNVVKSTQLYTNELSVEDLPEGIFILHILEGGHLLFTTKFVVSH